MRKIFVLTLLILLFAHPSARARENIKIRSGQARTDSEQVQTDSQTDSETDSEQAQADLEKVRTVSEQVQTDSQTDSETDSEQVQADSQTDSETEDEQVQTDSQAEDEQVQADSQTDSETNYEQIQADSETEDEQVQTDSQAEDEQVQADSQTDSETDSEQAQADSQTVSETDSEQVRADSQTDSRTDDVKPEDPTISDFDYEALALLSVELNPDENPDLVISLLKPYKDDENNKSFVFYSSLGLAYKNTGRFKEAIPTYVRALEIESDEPAAQYYLGTAYYKNNESSKALKYFLKSSAQKPDHPGVKEWIDKLTKELDICKAPNIRNLKRVLNRRINVNRQKSDKETRLRMYITKDGGRIQVLSVKNKIYSYGIDSDRKKPVDYIIIDTDGDGTFEKVISSKSIFDIPTWAYNPK
jgi:chemotaxis protein histidine kinase CheA